MNIYILYTVHNIVYTYIYTLLNIIYSIYNIYRVYNNMYASILNSNVYFLRISKFLKIFQI